jgi:hypothetical protein
LPDEVFSSDTRYGALPDILSGYGVNQELAPAGGLERDSVRQFSTAGSGFNAGLHPFFDFQNIAIKAVKTNLPYIVSFFVEYAKYGKVRGPTLGHCWELQPSVLGRTQFQEASALFP